MGTARGAHPLTPAVWAGTIVLCLVGIIVSIGRTIFLGDAVTRFEPVRARLFEATGRTDPLAARRAAELAIIDGQFSARPRTTRLHVFGGGLFFGSSRNLGIRR